MHRLDYEEIGRIVDKTPTNCRQIVRRAKQHLASQRPRFEVAPQHQEEITQRFLQACNSGDLQGLIALLSEDIVLWSDGGGKVVAALKPLHGAVKIARFLLAIQTKIPKNSAAEIVEINSQPGIIIRVDNQPQTVVSFEFANNQIRSIFIVVNPDKLKILANTTPNRFNS